MKYMTEEQKKSMFDWNSAIHVTNVEREYAILSLMDEIKKDATIVSLSRITGDMLIFVHRAEDGEFDVTDCKVLRKGFVK